MQFTTTILTVSLGLFGFMVVLLEVGRRLGKRRFARDPAESQAGLATIDAAMFAILGLLVAFTFSGAATRFDVRRQLVVEEANAIGTAYLRLDLLPNPTQPPLRKLFRDYLDARIDVYKKLPDFAASNESLARSVAIQGDIWTQAVAASKMESSNAAPILLLPALNQMIDITTTRTMAGKIHPPIVVFSLLFGLSFACSLIAGIGMGPAKKRNWAHILGFAGVMAVTVYVILDIEYPRLGLVRVDDVDQVLIDLRTTMK